MSKAGGVIILFIVSAVLYGSTLFNGFFWDDEDIIIEDKYIHSPVFAAYVFSPKYWMQDFPGAEGRYRPLRAVTLMADWQIWKKNAFGYHLTNFLLNFAAVVLVYAFASALVSSEQRVFPFVAALAFAAHPAHVESVAWIKNRTDILMTIFYLAAFLLFIRYYSAGALNFPNWLKILAVFALALASKEIAVTLSLAAAGYLVALRREPLAAALKKTAPLWVVSAVYALFVITLFRSDKLKAPVDVFGGIMAAAQYLRVLIFPYDLNAERVLVTALDFAGPAVFAASAVLFVKNKMSVGTFGLAWACVSILPLLDTRMVVSRPIAEQRLYLASAGTSLAVAALFGARPRQMKIAAAVLLLSFAGTAFARTLDWRRPVRFWEKTVSQAPSSERAWTNLGVAYERAGRYDEALAAYGKSIDMAPDNITAYLNAGALLFNAGDIEAAQKTFKAVLEKNADSVKGRLGLGRVYMAKGDFSSAEKNYGEIIRLEPAHPDALNALGIIADLQNKTDVSRGYYRKVLADDPRNQDALYNLAASYRKNGELAEARKTYEILLGHNPGHADALNNLGIVYDMSGDKEKAAAAFKKIIALRPDYFQANYNLGGIYLNEKKYVQALAEYSRVVEINPSHAQARKKCEELRGMIK